MLDCDIKSLLIVEDDDALRDRLIRSMEKRGFDVVSASGVAEAFAAIETDLPDYAVIDLRLIDGSGLDVMHELETRRPDVRAIVLIALILVM